MSFELAQHGGHIDAFAFCPHHPEKAVEMRYRLDCACRKPRPGMLLDLIERFAVDRKESFLIGDKQSDIRAAEAAGVDGYLFDSGNTGGDLAAFLSGVLNQRSA
jgi:D-glycero-D-manno-heptose 1,7-bisphosphate phosphatase